MTEIKAEKIATSEEQKLLETKREVAKYYVKLLKKQKGLITG